MRRIFRHCGIVKASFVRVDNQYHQTQVCIVLLLQLELAPLNVYFSYEPLNVVEEYNYLIVATLTTPI